MAVSIDELFKTLDYIVSSFSESEKAGLLEELLNERGRDTVLKLMFLTFCRDQLYEIAENKATMVSRRDKTRLFSAVKRRPARPVPNIPETKSPDPSTGKVPALIKKPKRQFRM